MGYRSVDEMLRDVVEIFGPGTKVWLPGSFPAGIDPEVKPDFIPSNPNAGLRPNQFRLSNGNICVRHVPKVANQFPIDHGGCPQRGWPESIDGPGAASLTRSHKNKVTESGKNQCPRPFSGGRYIEERSDGTQREGVKLFPCRSWDCPVCAKNNLRRMRVKILVGLEAQMAGVSELELPYFAKFLTLTAPGGEWRLKYGIEAREKLMRKALRDFVRRCRQRFGRFGYFWVGEPQRDGTLHFHMIVVGRGIMPKSVGAEMVTIWQDFCGMGFAKIKKTTGGARGLAAYLSSYLGKNVYRGLRERRVYGSNELFRAPWREKKAAFLATLPLRTWVQAFKIKYEMDGTRSFHTIWERAAEGNLSPADVIRDEVLTEKAGMMEFPWKYGEPVEGEQLLLSVNF